MLKSELQHQFWITKKSVQRKLGKKEDDCVVSSDSELDAKIELLKCIQQESYSLYRIIDQYQERICILAQEENALGKFLKENGKNSQTTDKIMISCGKAISYSGQIRISIRPSLLRLFSEVEVFRKRAVSDTQNTITLMEKERTEYRAALSWMKSISSLLDPDSGRGLDKFRSAQNHVRQSKYKFDRLSIDCLQKIDLLAASRCNMFSHTLVSYMASLLQFSMKSSDTLKALSSVLSVNPQYNFNILKGILHEESQNQIEGSNAETVDSDQRLFFLDEYRDNDQSSSNDINKTSAQREDWKSMETDKELDDIFNLVDISTSSAAQNYHYENGVDNNTTMLFDNLSNLSVLNSNKQEISTASVLNITNLTPTENCNESSEKISKINETAKTTSGKSKDSKVYSWFSLFSDLDPLANPDDIARRFDGKVTDNQAA